MKKKKRDEEEKGPHNILSGFAHPKPLLYPSSWIFFIQRLISPPCLSHSSLSLDLCLTPPPLPHTIPTTPPPATIRASPLSTTLTTADYPKYPKQSQKQKKSEHGGDQPFTIVAPYYHRDANESSGWAF